MEIVTLSKARQLNLKHYYTGNPCKRGHVSRRITSSRACETCSKDKSSSINKKYYLNNKTRIIEKVRKYYKKNKDKVTTRNRQYYKENKEVLKAKVKDYQRKNKGKVNARVARRKAQKLKASVTWANKKILQQIYISCPEGYHVDHIIPLIHPLICGLHVESNLQYLTKSENSSKGNTFVPYIEIKNND